MATAVVKVKDHPFSSDVLLYKWILTADEHGEKVVVPRHSDKTVHLFGTFGGTVLIEGGLDPDMADDSADMFTLDDPEGALLSFTAADLKTVLQNVYKIGPVAGSGVTSVTIFIMVR